MGKLYKIRFLKDTELKKKGDIANCSKKNAESYITNGYAEYVNEGNGFKKSRNLNLKKRGINLLEEIKIAEEKEKTKKEVKSSIEEVPVTDTTHTTHTTDTTHTTNEPCVVSVTFVVCDKRISDAIFGENTFEKILKILATEKETFTYDKIAERMGKDHDLIRQAISRKRDYFDIKKPDGKVCNVFLSQMAVDEIKLRIEQFKQNEEQKRKYSEHLKEEESKIEELETNILTFIRECPLKRDGGVVYLNFKELCEYNPDISDTFLDNPSEFIEIIRKHYNYSVKVNLLNLPNNFVLNIEEIRAEHLNQIICVEGRITSFGEVKPIITQITFQCPSCGNEIVLEQNYRTGILNEPKKCFQCNRCSGFKIVKRTIQNSCFLQFEDLQENTDNPHSQRIKAILFDDMCNKEKIKIFNPGNEIKCLGVLKEVPVIKNKNKTPFLNWILEIMSAELIEKDIDINTFSDDEFKRIKELSKEIDDKGINYLYESFAPDVYGYEEIKGAIILQLCNSRNDKRNRSVRNKSNILMIGDPGIAKSVLGDFALQISNGGRKAVGGGSSAVGITASVVKEEDSLGGYRVEPGAMILAKDLLFIDELNNLSEEDKPKLQEGMNEQTISINKANLHVQMKVTAGIIAAANPIYGSFKDDEKLSIQEQFNIPTPILNRFDSIFVMKDNINEHKDKLIAERMIMRHRKNISPVYEISFLKKFFTYIKNFNEPEINKEIQKIFEEVYSLARQTYNPTVRINPRFLESLTRMSISSAKLRQSKLVELKDIQTSLNILSKTQYNINELILSKLIEVK